MTRACAVNIGCSYRRLAYDINVGARETVFTCLATAEASATN